MSSSGLCNLFVVDAAPGLSQHPWLSPLPVIYRCLFPSLCSFPDGPHLGGSRPPPGLPAPPLRPGAGAQAGGPWGEGAAAGTRAAARGSFPCSRQALCLLLSRQRFP